LIEDLSSAAPDTVAYTNAVVELFVDPLAKIEYVSLQNLSRETWHFGRHKAWLERDSELDWVIGGFGSKRGTVWIENDLAGPGATARVTAPTSRTATSTSTTTRSRSTSRRRPRATSRSRARCARTRARSGAG